MNLGMWGLFEVCDCSGAAMRSFLRVRGLAITAASSAGHESTFPPKQGTRTIQAWTNI